MKPHRKRVEIESQASRAIVRLILHAMFSSGDVVSVYVASCCAHPFAVVALSGRAFGGPETKLLATRLGHYALARHCQLTAAALPPTRPTQKRVLMTPSSPPQRRGSGTFWRTRRLITSDQTRHTPHSAVLSPQTDAIKCNEPATGLQAHGRCTVGCPHSSDSIYRLTGLTLRVGGLWGRGVSPDG